jgi:ketosteroid isomerase-like protein
MPENLEIVQAAFAAYLRGDEAGMLALASPEIVVTQFPDQLDVRDFHGRDGLREMMVEWIGTWDDFTVELRRAREIGDVVLVSALQRGRGEVSGVPIEEEVTFAFTVRDGAVARWQIFHSEEEALADLGLEE